MNRQKFMIITCLAMLVALWGINQAQAMPASPTDETKVPHYFGPYPNWALSPLPALTPGACSVTTATACTTNTECPTGETCNGVTVAGGGIRKFVDTLPGLTPAGVNNLGKYIPVAAPDTTTYPGSDYYEIGLVQYREKMHSDLPPTLLRGYVQLSTGVVPGSQVSLSNALLTGGTAAIAGYLGVDSPHYLGPVIVATKDRPVRILFRNLLPTGSGGDLFLPTDSSMMGSGMGPMVMGPPFANDTVMDDIRNPICTEYPKGDGCFKDNRATLHLHGGVTPWISDGTPHQWITPANESTPWPQGVSVKNVPDMDVCGAANDGCQTFYYTNQQSARLMFYHDHAWGITRLNVYAGEAAGYLITDDTEKALVSANLIPGATDTIPLIIQDRTFVPDATQLAAQDPTWDATRWGGLGNLWYHHVYMPAQNPGDVGGMSGYGRWMYGPWFWPPATPTFGPIANPYYNATCLVDDPTTWQYQTDPFCEPEFIPGTPNISVGMEQFNDTPIVNGTVYPTVTLEPKTYRLRLLNAANDRFFNFQWYVGDPTTASTATNGKGEIIGATEVALNPTEVAAAQLDPVVFPTPVLKNLATAGPAWIQIGTEGGFLPAPVVIDGQQPTTWITDPTRFDVGNVDLHSLLLAPAERADVIVDFSAFAGQTLILYNDAPAAFPARVPSYDYYTGYPDQSPVGPATILPGYGPNSRTIMQVKIAGSPAPAFNLTALQNAFKPASTTNTTGIGVFKNGQHPIIVGQAAYNSAYFDMNDPTVPKFTASSWCNAPGSTKTRCDGYARIFDQGGNLFGFNTLLDPAPAPAPTGSKFLLPLQPKALHDEMNSVAFDEFGRMTANIGIEAVPASPAAQNVTLYPYVNPATEMIDATNLPKGVSVTPIASQDGTQIWKITHNGVDTHPIHFHLYDVQLLNRVTWDNIIIPPDANELGWKDTVRISPLEDTLVALRPVIPILPFDLPNSIRPLNPMMAAGDTSMFNNIDPQGNPTANITNQLVNFGWEYVWHCHILSHEEMDMMRPVSVGIPPVQPNGLAFTVTGNGNNRRLNLTWNDNSISETAFLVQKTTDGTIWIDVGTSPSPLDQPNTTGPRSLTDPITFNPNTVVKYQVVAQNTIGYGAEFPSMTVKSVSPALIIGSTPSAPTGLTATLQAGPQISLAFTDNATTEIGFALQRSTNNGAFTQIAMLPARNNTGGVTYIDTAVTPGSSYAYRVAAVNVAGTSGNSNTVTMAIPSVPAIPGTFTAANGPNGTGNNRTVILTWQDLSLNETGFTIQRATNAAFTTGLNSTNVAAGTGTGLRTFTQTGLARNTQYFYRIRSNNGTIITSAWRNATPFPITTNP